MTKNPVKKWVVRPHPPEQATKVLDAPPIISLLLYHRGISDARVLEAFLDTDLRHLHDPFLMPGMREAARRIYQGILSTETIAVFGDFDVDGVTGTLLLTKALEALGARVIPYIPHRVHEGHGLNSTAVQELRRQGASLLVTVDCGITSRQEVEEANSMGIDVVITDHHAPPTAHPPAYAIVSPALGEYPFKGLSGAGLALKLTQGLYQLIGRQWDAGLLELAALGTVADLSPLSGENRIIVTEGLRVMQQAPSVALCALCQMAGIDTEDMDTEAVSYAIAPRLNASGRLAHAFTSYRLLAATSTEEALPLAAEIEALNRRRQELTTEALQLAWEDVISHEPLPPLIFVARQEFDPGINGLVASKLVEAFYRPVVVVAIDDLARGSARSIPEFDIADALEQCGDLFQRYGGHPRAGGFTTDVTNLTQLQERLVSIAGQRLGGLDLSPRIIADAEVSPGELNGEILRWLHRLEPFGEGNPEPVFLGRGVQVLRAWPMGTNGEHLRLVVRSGGVTWDAVGFGLAEKLPNEASTTDMVYSLGTDSWGGRKVLSLRVIDVAAPGLHQ